MTKQPIGVFISGRGTNLQSIIDASKSKSFPYKVKIVFSDNHHAKGINLAKKFGIDNFSLEIKDFKNKREFEEQILKLIQPYDLRLICLAGFMKILSSEFIEHYPNKILNIHPSLLPKYKGLNTHKRVLENNDDITGCTVHYVNHELDAGEIIVQKTVKVDASDTVTTLADKVLKQENLIFPEAIKMVLKK